MNRKEHAFLIRGVRKIHRTLGATLCLFFLVVSLSGLLLGWKKNSNGLILPKSHYGISRNLKDWLPFDSLHTIACSALHFSVNKNLSIELERMDARPQKGMVKFVFKDHYWGVQVDGATGKVLHIERRRSDIIENIHDGSILDYFFKTEGEILKLIYTSVMGLSLLIFIITGFWLWFGPKVMRRISKRNRL
ncbi:PepSY domain-containing protein [uncultured Polaribacter sp.]|uniref:PepSY domain-containing protein n=1 Tax=uncultured Polaribacter sp. TaxID=174711 RepID=UPI002616DA5E|nr:PepSY domain-containing protein [uncultured Polaribacter sp.]